jgi:hypothetical protein
LDASLILLFFFALEYAAEIQESQGRFGLNGTPRFMVLVFYVNSLSGLDKCYKNKHRSCINSSYEKHKTNGFLISLNQNAGKIILHRQLINPYKIWHSLAVFVF